MSLESFWLQRLATARGDPGPTRLVTGRPDSATVVHSASEQLLLSSAFKSGRQVTMAKTAPVPCEASPSLAGGTGPSAKPGQLHVTGAAAAQRPLRRPDTETPGDSERKQLRGNARLLCERFHSVE